ncbi:FeoA family protein [Pedobacter sp. NJ-S-72]
MTSGKSGIIIGVSEHSSPFLIHLEKLGLTIGVPVTIVEITDYDGSVELMVNNQRINVSRKVAQHILLKL